jgi:hypothetical protein
MDLQVHGSSATDVNENSEERAVSIFDEMAAVPSVSDSSIIDAPLTRPIGVKRAKLEKETLSASDSLRRTLESGFTEQRKATESVKSAFSEQISELTDVFSFAALPEGQEKTKMMHKILRTRSERQCVHQKEYARDDSQMD